MLIQIQRRIELSLFRQQFLQPRLMLERPAHLRLIIREGFFLPLDFVLFFLSAPVETAEGMLDA
jgi:hypothetical protein